MNRQFVRYVVGLSVLVEAFFLFITSLIASAFNEHTFLSFFLISLVAGFLGFISFKNKPESPVFYALEGFVSVALSWVAISIVGAIPMYLTGEFPSFVDTVFEIVSGFTTTGSSILSDIEALSKSTLFFRSLTHWIGGMGVLVFVLAVLPMAGGYAMNIMKAESPGPSVGKFVSKVSSTAKILYAIYTGLTVLETVVLMSQGVDLFNAVCIAFETAGTGGFGNFNNSMAHYGVNVQVIVTFFMIVFGVNFNVYYFILIGKTKDAFKSEELRVYLGIIVISALLIGLNIMHLYNNVALAFHDSLFQVASIMTTTGFSTTDFDIWPTFSKTILITLMFIGACAGSTGGGIKVSRIVIALKDSFNSLMSFAHPRLIKRVKFENKPVDKDTIGAIRIYIMIYAFVFFVSLLIVSLDNFDFATNFSAVAATYNNIGPGINLVGPSCNFASFSVLSKIVLMFDMLAGRLELLPMLILFVPLLSKRR